MDKLTLTDLNLPLKHAFTITRGSRTVASNLLLKVERNGLIGYGEFAPNKRYDESVDTVRKAVKGFDPSRIKNPLDMVELHAYLNELYPHEGSVKAGIEMAYADLMGKSIGLPLHRIWNAPTTTGPMTSFTIGIDSEDMIRQKVAEAEPYPVLKVKLGTNNDRDIMRLIRSLTRKEVWIDANEGWTDPEEAIDLARFMHRMNVKLVEQPMPAHMTDELAMLKLGSPVPIIADEGFTGSEDMAQIARCYHGINLKLMKTGGMVPALHYLWKARQYGMKVMVGCMLESSIANTAAAIVALWADFCDLDSHILISDDPFVGLQVGSDGRVRLNELPGLGVQVRT
jgi:L-Ala-D/L-Glu epimerase